MLPYLPSAAALALVLAPAPAPPTGPPTGPLPVTFHFMQVQKILGGVNGDTSAQAIQLRMRTGSQNLVAQARLVAHDAQGLNPVVVLDIPSNVANGGAGDTVLIASSSFLTSACSTGSADFTMANTIPASYLAAGSLTFEDDAGTAIYWRVSWGGASYTGSTTGVAIANDADGEFGPPFAGALPSTGTSALEFQGPANAPSTSNDVNYAVAGGASLFTDNAGVTYVLPAAASETVRLGSPANPNVYSPGTTTAPIIGTTWDPAITPFVTGAFLDFVMIAPPTQINTLAPPLVGTLLCNIPSPNLLFFTTPNNPFAINLPSKCSLIGKAKCTQGGSIAPGPTIHMANAIDITIGTF